MSNRFGGRAPLATALRMESVENQILDYISRSPTRVAFRSLRKRFAQLTLRSLKREVAALVRSGRLSYTYEFGNSYLVMALHRPMLVSPHVVLAPPDVSFSGAPGQVVVTLNRGGAFGLGDHPTTRMAIQLIDAHVHSALRLSGSETSSALDIGTGSGVLAIVLARLGLGVVTAVDTDVCAVCEARANVQGNGLDGQVVVCRGDAHVPDKRFNLIVANLRTPTLMALRSRIEILAGPNSGLIFSGFRQTEAHSIRQGYEQAGFRMLKCCTEKGWGAISFARGA